MKNTYLILLAFLILPFQYLKAEEVTTTIYFSHDSLTCNELECKEGNPYCLLSYSGLGNDGKLGCPLIPVKYVTLNVPYEATNIMLNVEAGNTSSHVLKARIHPAQRGKSLNSNISDNSLAFECNEALYESKSIYPQENAFIKNIFSTDNKNKEIRIALYPVRYVPSSNRYDFCEEIRLTVSYTCSSRKKMAPASSGMTDIGLPYYEYCVITNRALKKSFSRLIGWKRQKGWDAGVVCVEDIMENPNIQGDVISNLTDSAGKIRQYLRIANKPYPNSSNIYTKYVLIGGDATIVPTRYGDRTCDQIDVADEDADMIVPSDVYYSELNFNWSNQYFGENNDGSTPSYDAPIAIGRLLCTTSDEVKNYTDKLIRYEMNPGHGSSSYVVKALLQQCDVPQRDGQAQYVASNSLQDSFTTIDYIEESPSYNAPYVAGQWYPYGHDVISSMNNHYGYVSWSGHGNPYSIKVCSQGVEDRPYSYLLSVNGIPTEDTTPGDSNNGLNNLSNNYYPMLAYTVSCNSVPFDTYMNYDDYPNLGKSFTLGESYGGPAIVGNTRQGLICFSYLLQTSFNNYLTNYDNTLGEALRTARFNNYPVPSGGETTNFDSYMCLSTNLLGCPEMRMWTAVPEYFDATIDNYESGSDVSVNNSNVDLLTVGMREFLYESGDTITRTSNAYPSTSENCLVTVTGKNFLPKILPFMLQNTVLNDTAYVFTKDVTCSWENNSLNTIGVTFEPGSDYHFESSGTFRINKSFKVERGAKLIIAPADY